MEDRDRVAQVAASEQARHWQAVAAGSEQLGDAILLRIVGRPIHVGVVIAPGRMLHTEQTTGAVIEGYTGRKWAQRVSGFYRWAG
jgi:cell wall-associated NlpC family hydrolase